MQEVLFFLFDRPEIIDFMSELLMQKPLSFLTKVDLKVFLKS